MEGKKKLSLEDLSDVSGGAGESPNNLYGPFHNGCGGKILHCGNIFRSCECKKCGEKHYFRNDFDYYTIARCSSDRYVKIYKNGTEEEFSTRPPELDQ